jgi:hypothetical protein
MLKEIAHSYEIMLYMEKWKNIYYVKIADVLRKFGKKSIPKPYKVNREI